MAAQSCVGCKRWLPGKALEPHSHCVSCRPAMCSAEDQCSECSHLSLLQFQAYVKDAEKRSAKKKKQAKSSGGSREKCSHQQEPASEAPWASRFVAVEADLAAMKASIGQLSAVLLLLASGSAFSGFADGRASVHPPLRLVPGVAGPRSPPGSDPSVAAAGSSGASLSVSPLSGLAPGVNGGRAPSVSSSAPELAVGGCGSGIEWFAGSRGSCFFRGRLGVGGLSLRAVPLSGKASGFVGCQLLPGQSPPWALLVTETRDFMQHHSLVPPRPFDVGADPGSAVVSQAAAMGWPSFSEEVDQVFDDIPSGEAGSPDEEGASSFRELITSVRESLGLPMPSSLASTLQTGVKHTSGTSRSWCCLVLLWLWRYREGSDCHSALEATVSKMLLKGAIELVVDPQASFYSRIFLVPKSTGGQLGQRKEFLGMVLDTIRARVFPSPDRVNQFQAVAQQFLLARLCQCPSGGLCWDILRP
ncbi:hypothetical protein E2C01_048283 [Portunus trituberculatus]|uniref:Uncharacterized protein n=1 Tax=Portunus trituberculatus TaxID=210409 RepID=A0A5B7G601_PORTR|nr:hypothetical protein [Portunus trituberculatus]